jgi:hypothetical protein
MTRARRVRALTLAVCGLLLACAPGCISTRGPSDVRRQLGDELGWELDREMGLRVGRATLWLARSLVPEEEGSPLGDVSRVEIGVYRLLAEAPPRPGSGHLRLKGLQPMVRVRGGASDAAILVRPGRKLREMVLISREADEVVVVRLEGRLDRFLGTVIETARREEGRWGAAARRAPKVATKEAATEP